MDFAEIEGSAFEMGVSIVSGGRPVLVRPEVRSAELVCEWSFIRGVHKGVAEKVSYMASKFGLPSRNFVRDLFSGISHSFGELSPWHAEMLGTRLLLSNNASYVENGEGNWSTTTGETEKRRAVLANMSGVESFVFSLKCEVGDDVDFDGFRGLFLSQLESSSARSAMRSGMSGLNLLYSSFGVDVLKEFRRVKDFSGVCDALSLFVLIADESAQEELLDAVGNGYSPSFSKEFLGASSFRKSFMFAVSVLGSNVPFGKGRPLCSILKPDMVSTVLRVSKTGTPEDVASVMFAMKDEFDRNPYMKEQTLSALSVEDGYAGSVSLFEALVLAEKHARSETLQRMSL